MCLAIPGEITNIEGEFAKVKIMGIESKVNIGLIQNPKVGDYLLIHTGFAIEKIDTEYFDYLKDMIKKLLESEDTIYG